MRLWLSNPKQRRYTIRAASARAMLQELTDPCTGTTSAISGYRYGKSLRKLVDRTRAAAVDTWFSQRGLPHPNPTLHPPTRFIVHAIVVILALVITSGESLQSWSLRATQPWQERAPGVLGGGNLTDEVVGEGVPFMGALAPSSPAGRGTEELAPVLQVPLPDNGPAFSDIYQLVQGETLGDIAARYGVTLESLIWSNGLQVGDVLAVGQELRIPRVSGLPYTIQAGDTLDGIAAQFGVAPEAILLFDANQLRPEEPLPVGREVFIPGGTQPLPAALLELRGGREGLAGSTAQLAGVVRESGTNMRDGPDLANTRVAQLAAGRRAQLLARYEQWLKVDVAGTSGWVRADMLDVPEGMVAALPETNDFPPPPPIWVWPTHGAITSYFGPRWGGFHNGLDVANRAWTPIVAARSGYVSEAGWCSGYGYCVKLTHGGGLQTIYGHLIDQPVVASGEEVTAGQLIGHMGSTYDARGGGYSTGVHLHFTVTVNGRAVDPLKFLP